MAENITYVTGVTSYSVKYTDDIINVDTSVYAVTVILPATSLLVDNTKRFYIVDYNSNCATNNITIISSNSYLNGVNVSVFGTSATVNGQPSVVLNTNGTQAECFVSGLVNDYGVNTPSTSGGSGTVTSVSGTTGRITVTGTTAVVIDIAATYVGQTSITTLGTITTGTWQATPVGITYGGTGQTTAVLAFNALSPLNTLGDTLYFDGTNNVRLAPNTSTTLKVLTQVGDGTNSTAPSWQPVPASGEYNYFFVNIASDISTYLEMINPVSGVEAYVTDATPANAKVIQVFATNSGIPGITFIPSGIWEMRIHGYKSGGTKTVRLYGNIYKRDLGGIETLLGTTGLTSALTTVEQDLGSVNVTIGDTILLSTDRIVCKIVESITGTGSAPTSITIGFAGTTSARLSFPGSNADITNFVPYTGAVSNIDVNSKNITTTGYVIMQTQSLNDNSTKGATTAYVDSSLGVALLLAYSF